MNGGLKIKTFTLPMGLFFLITNFASANTTLPRSESSAKTLELIGLFLIILGGLSLVGLVVSLIRKKFFGSQDENIKTVPTIIAALILLIGGGGLFFVGYKPQQPEKSLAIDLTVPGSITSAEQTQLFYNGFGAPDTFFISYDRELGRREEVWSYPAYDFATSFINGRYLVSKQSIEPLHNDPFPMYNPLLFAEVETLEDVTAQVNERPVKAGDISPEVIAGGEVYLYPSGLIVVTRNNYVVSIYY